jgi:hypothetical protein
MPELRAIPTSRFYVEFQGLEQKMVKSVTELNFKGQTAGHKSPLASTKDGKHFGKRPRQVGSKIPTSLLKFISLKGTWISTTG